jgi:transposase
VEVILSVVESCRRLDVPVKEYLAAVLPGMNQRTLSEVSPLTPARWKSAQSLRPGLVPRDRFDGIKNAH